MLFPPERDWVWGRVSLNQVVTRAGRGDAIATLDKHLLPSLAAHGFWSVCHISSNLMLKTTPCSKANEKEAHRRFVQYPLCIRTQSLGCGLHAQCCSRSPQSGEPGAERPAAARGCSRRRGVVSRWDPGSSPGGRPAARVGRWGQHLTAVFCLAGTGILGCSWPFVLFYFHWIRLPKAGHVLSSLPQALPFLTNYTQQISCGVVGATPHLQGGQSWTLPPTPPRPTPALPRGFWSPRFILFRI